MNETERAEYATKCQSYRDEALAEPFAIRVAAYTVRNGVGELTDTIGHAVVQSTYVATEEEAAAVAARFPKSTRPKVQACDFGCGFRAFAVTFGTFSLAADGANGGRNETGLRRIASVVKTTRKLGLTLGLYQNGRGALPVNQVPTLDETLAALAL